MFRGERSAPVILKSMKVKPLVLFISLFWLTILPAFPGQGSVGIFPRLGEGEPWIRERCGALEGEASAGS